VDYNRSVVSARSTLIGMESTYEYAGHVGIIYSIPVEYDYKSCESSGYRKSSAKESRVERGLIGPIIL
jgi:hypothetical protein